MSGAAAPGSCATRPLAVGGRTMLALFALLLAAGRPAAAEVLREPPARPAPGQRFLFYLHGQIVEGSDGRPVHPQLGPYEYRSIASAFEERGFVVVSEIRPAGTRVEAAAERVASQVRALLAAGVEARHIGVVGHSKGGVIARLASSRLAEPELSFVLLAGCFAGRGEPPPAPVGRVLSLVDRSDRVAEPCAPGWDAGAVGLRRETLLSLGGGHGLFYRPREEWVDAVAAWLQGAG